MEAGAAPPPRITITSTALAAPPDCRPAALAVSATTYSDTSSFRLRIRVDAPLCDPVSATAAVYAMPRDGSVWPQTLVETAAVDLRGPAIVDVVFTKDCTPAQFDVVTGATPAVIAPWADGHGPLLIPDVATAYQDPGIACGPAPTSTVAPTTTLATGPGSTTASTTAPTATTTTAVVRGATTTTPAVAVLGTSSGSGSGTSSPAALAVTGVPSQALLVWGVGLVALGAALLARSRRHAPPMIRMVTTRSSVHRASPFSTS